MHSLMLPWKLPKRQILPVNQNFSSVYFSLAKILQMTYTHKLPKLCSATLNLFREVVVGNSSTRDLGTKPPAPYLSAGSHTEAHHRHRHIISTFRFLYMTVPDYPFSANQGQTN